MKIINLFKLSKVQLVVLSEITRDIAQIFFASSVVTPIILGVDRINWTVSIIGGLISLLLWILSVIIVKK